MNRNDPTWTIILLHLLPLPLPSFSIPFHKASEPQQIDMMLIDRVILPLRRLARARYVTASILCSLGGFLLGLDTSIIGPVTVMDTFIEKFGKHSAAVQGILVSSILLSAALSSCFAGRLADVWGRPHAMAFGAAIFTVGAVLQAGAVHLAMFATGRAVQGVGYGLYFGTQTVYISEIAPPRIRGPLTSGPQFMTTVALVVGYFVSFASVNISGSLSWRLPFILTAAVAVGYVLVNLFLLPESPRWLITHGRHSDAMIVWDKLGVKREDREAEQVNASSEGTTADTPNRTRVTEDNAKKHASFRDLWSPDVRKHTFLSAFLMGFLQLCGIDAVLYYAPLLFKQAGLESQQASFLASGVSAIVIVASSIPATLLADRWGRRTSTLVGGVGLTATMILIGGLYAGKAVHSAQGAGRWIVIVTIYIYCIVQATTWGISIKVWAPEIQPQHTRAQATSLAYGCNWVCNFFVALIAPILLDKSASAAYFLFGGSTALATVVSFFYMVETKGKSLDEIERAFRKRIPAPGAAIQMPVHASPRPELKST
ncbi:general substrate transporter [Nemania sp. FL0916]|nr:general substrate transporter [Nemania sp. FL0916]